MNAYYRHWYNPNRALQPRDRPTPNGTTRLDTNSVSYANSYLFRIGLADTANMAPALHTT